jgi:hypothetical protein
MHGGDSDGKHLVDPVEEEGWQLTLPLDGVVAVLALHGQLPSLAWAFAQALPGARLGYVQTGGDARLGEQSAEVLELCARGLLAGQLAAGATRVGEGERALTTAGALYHGLRTLGWDAAVCAPGPHRDAAGAHGNAGAHRAAGAHGNAGAHRAAGASEVSDNGHRSRDGGSDAAHGGLAALDDTHTALALGCPVLLVPRMSSGEPRTRRRGISPETLAVLDLLLQPVTVALPAGLRSPVGADLRAGLGAVFGAPRSAPAQLELNVARPARIARHDWRRAPLDLPAFAAAGLPTEAAARGLVEDPLFFGATLAAGATLAELLAEQRGERPAAHVEDGEGAAA